MNIINYDSIIENCKRRTGANFNKINEYITEYDWKTFILKRHQTFIKKYIDTNYDIKKTSNFFNYSIKDLSSIFLRIESQFEIYSKSTSMLKFSDLIFNVDQLMRHPLTDNSYDVKKIEKSTRENKTNKILPAKKKLQKIEINPKLNIPEKNDKLILILEEMKNLPNLVEIIGPTINLYVEELLNGRSIAEIAKNKKRNEKYLISMLVGRKNPRSHNEMGLERLLKKFKEN